MRFKIDLIAPAVKHVSMDTKGAGLISLEDRARKGHRRKLFVNEITILPARYITLQEDREKKKPKDKILNAVLAKQERKYA